MLDYRCPACDALQFRADGPLVRTVEIKCRRCSTTIEPKHVSQPLHRTYRCSECGRTNHVERPEQDKTHCIVCGTPTLVIVSETPGGVKEREKVRVRRG